MRTNQRPFVLLHKLLSQVLFVKTQTTAKIIGYELSIDINFFEESLKESINDKSLHPIFIAKKINGEFEVNKYISNDGKVNEQKVKTLQEYLDLVGLSI